jgi:UDP-2,3-diacylglucosamine pyrophosphatase LpxH
VAKDASQIKKALTAACDRQRKQVLKGRLDLAASKVVVLSDLHRGARSGSDDDFWRCEEAYNSALGYYLMSGYTLILLGDVDELWENSPKDLVGRYAQTTELEKSFYNENRLLRVFGNHDDLWAHAGRVDKFFRNDFPGLVIYEALRFDVVDAYTVIGELVLAHGHQGSSAADRTGFGRLAVRFGYRRLQRAWNVSANTPARDYALRGLHDRAMRDWALDQQTDPAKPAILIAGHTHQPVFGTSQPPKPNRRELVVVQAEYDAAVASGDGEPLPSLRAELEMLKTLPFGTTPVEMPIPCYFNAGCCCFFDGDITGIEIEGGQIRLVRWLDDEWKPIRKELVSDDLRAIFAAVGAREMRETPVPPPGKPLDS